MSNSFVPHASSSLSMNFNTEHSFSKSFLMYDGQNCGQFKDSSKGITSTAYTRAQPVTMLKCVHNLSLNGCKD